MFDMGDIKIYKLKEAAKVLMTSEYTVSQHLKNGELHGQKVGREWRITSEDIKAFLARK